MIRSMTGYGRAAGTMSRHAVDVVIKSVNHRSLDVSVRIPEFLWELEPAVRSLAAELFSRGKLDVAIRVQRTTEPEYRIVINSRLAGEIVPRLKSIAEEQGISTAFSASDLMRVPDLVSVQPMDSEIEQEDRDALKAIVREALLHVRSMRESEGTALQTDIARRVTLLEETRAELEAMREQVVGEMLELFRQRVGEIAKVAGIAADDERLVQEVLLMVEKGDIAEELTRMQIHLVEIRSAIEGDDPAGKKLDFLSQEMLREINTVGSKSRSSTIRSAVVRLKTEVERIREQVQNVE